MGVPNEQKRDPQAGAEAPAEDHLTLEDLGEIPMTIEVLLGGALMTVRDVLALKEGAVVPLRKMAGEMSDVYVNGMALGRGEIVVIGDNLSIRIAEVTGTQSDHQVDSA